MRQSTEGQKTSIQWTFVRQLEDLDGRYQHPLPQTTRRTREARLCCSWGREYRPQDQHREDRDPTHQQQTARPSQTTARRDQGSGQVHLPGQCSAQGRWTRRRYQEPHQQSQTRLQNPHAHLAIFSPLTPQKIRIFNTNVKSCSHAIRLRNVAHNKDQLQKQITNIRQPVPAIYPEHQVAGNHLKQRTLGKDKTSPS